MVHPQNATVNSETELMDAALRALRAATKPVEAETMDLACGMSFDDWREVYGVSGTPGYSEWRGDY